MSLVAVTSASPGSGKTTVAVLLAYGLLAQGQRVLPLRAKDPAEEAGRAAADAAVLASIEGVRAPTAGPVDPAEAARRAREAGKDGVTVVEAPAAAAGVASKGGWRFVLAVPGLSDASLEASRALARDLGVPPPAKAVAIRVPSHRLPEAPAVLAGFDLDCLGVLPEDGLLAAPRVGELARALQATYLYEDGDPDAVAEHLMIGSVGADPGQPYFGRHERKAAITRFDKTDVQLAALASPPLACLILTGGQEPSPYLLDRVQSEEVPILLTRHETVAAMQVLGEIYGATRLGGPEKLERLRQLSKGLDSEKLSALLT